IGMRRLVGARLERTILIESGELFGVAIDPGIVRSGEVEAEPERLWPLLLTIDEPHRLVGQHVADITLDRHRLVLVDHRRAVVRPHARLVCEPAYEIGPPDVACAEVPLAN